MKKQWDVDWCEAVPANEFGDPDLDRAKNVSRRFATREQAVEFAKQAAGESYWGVAQVRAVTEVNRSAIETEDDLEWWIEDQKIMAYVGESEDVEP